MDELNKNDGLQRVGEAFVAVEKKGTTIAASTWKRRAISLERTASQSSKSFGFKLCFREHQSSAKRRSRFSRSHTVYIMINRIFAISTKTCEYGIEYVIPILQILTAEKVYYLKMQTVPELRSWVAALKVAVSTSTNVPHDQALYHMLIPPKQPIREGDTLLRFERDSLPPCIVFEDPITCKAIHRINLTSINSFGTIMKSNQGWLQLSTESKSSSSDQDSTNGVRIYFQCSVLVDFTLALKTNVDRASSFKRQSCRARNVVNSFKRRSCQMEYDWREEDVTDELTDGPSPLVRNNTYPNKAVLAACTSFDSSWSPYRVPSCSKSEEKSGSRCITSSSDGGSGMVPKEGVKHQDEKGKEWTRAFKDSGEIQLLQRLSGMFNSNDDDDEDDDDVVTFSRHHDAASGQAFYQYHHYQKLSEIKQPPKHCQDQSTLDSTSQEQKPSPLTSPSGNSPVEQDISDDHQSSSSTLTVPPRKSKVQRQRHRYVNCPLPIVGKEPPRGNSLSLNSDFSDNVSVANLSASLMKMLSHSFDQQSPSFELENTDESNSNSRTASPITSGQKQEQLLSETSEVSAEEKKAQSCETLEDSGYMLMISKRSCLPVEESPQGRHSCENGLRPGEHSPSLLRPSPVSFSPANSKMCRGYRSSAHKSRTTAVFSSDNDSRENHRFPSLRHHSSEVDCSQINDEQLRNHHSLSQRPCAPPGDNSPCHTSQLLPPKADTALKNENRTQTLCLASLPGYATLLLDSDNVPEESHFTPPSLEPKSHPAPRRPICRSNSLPRCSITRCSSDGVFQVKDSWKVPPKSQTLPWPARRCPREENNSRQASGGKWLALLRRHVVRLRRETSASSQSQSTVPPSHSKTSNLQRNVDDCSPENGTQNTKWHFEQLMCTESSWV